MSMCTFQPCVMGAAAHVYNADKCAPAESPFGSEDDQAIAEGPDTLELDSVTSYNSLMRDFYAGEPTTLHSELDADTVCNMPTISEEIFGNASSPKENVSSSREIIAFLDSWTSFTEINQLKESPHYFFEKAQIMIKAPDTLKEIMSGFRVLAQVNTALLTEFLLRIVGSSNPDDIKMFSALARGAMYISSGFQKLECTKSYEILSHNLELLTHHVSAVKDNVTSQSDMVESLRESVNKVVSVTSKLEAEAKLLDIKAAKNSPYHASSLPSSSSVGTPIQITGYKCDPHIIVCNKEGKVDVEATLKANKDLSSIHKKTLDVLALFKPAALQFLMAVDWSTLNSLMPVDPELSVKQAGEMLYTKFRSLYGNRMPRQPETLTLRQGKN